MAEENKIIKIHCNDCGHETKHILLRSRDTSGSDWDDNYGDLPWTMLYEMLECCGCESVCLRRTSYFEPADETTIEFYPPLVSRRFPKWRYKLPAHLYTLMNEIYNALHADSRRLAIMGARTVIDIVILEKVGDVGSFRQKLEGLEKCGLIGRKNREFLSAALDAGSAAAHRGFIPKAEEVDHVMDITENLLEAVYILDKAAENLKKATPQRKKQD